MKKIIIKWLIFALIIMGTCYLPGIEVENFAYAMLIAAILTVINLFIKPIVSLITIPLNLFSFGIFNLLVNYGFLYLTAFLVPQYKLENPLSAFIASIIIAIAFCIIKKK